MEQTGTHITVLMPCKNAGAAFFRQALKSVFSQTSPAWELVVIDDHSDLKETLDILKELQHSEDTRVSVVQNASHMVTGALNTGMHHARTSYVCSLHCDDLLDREAIEVLNAYIKRFPDIDYLHSSRIFIDENSRPLSRIIMARETFNLADFKVAGPVKHLHCWKIESALAIGGMDEALGLHGADDYDFPWCMAEAGCTFKAIPECLYYYRDHREHYRLTTHVPLDAQVKELTKIWRKHGLTDSEIDEQIRVRTEGYLRQALYLDDKDKRRKEKDGYDIRLGWRELYDGP